MNAVPVCRFPYRVPFVAWGLAFGDTGLVGCSEAKSPSVSVEWDNSTGVEIVTNHGGDVPLDWRFEEVLRIGGADDGPEAFGTRLRALECERVVQEGLEIRRVVRPDASPRRATVRDASLEVPDPMVMRGGAVECRVPASDVVETRGIAEYVPTVFQIRTSPDGVIWVNRLPRRA